MLIKILLVILYKREKMVNYNFKPGLELNREFFKQIIKPLLEKNYPHLSYSASLIGYGSDVLGFDNKTSMDHNWGPRCQIFLDKDNIGLKNELLEFFSKSLPFEFLGFPTNYTDPQIHFIQSMEKTSKYPLFHLIEIDTFENYIINYLSINDLSDINNNNWVNFTDQQLLEIVSGEVFYDGLNKVNIFRNKINFYPNDIMKLKLASLWSCISNEEAFVGRAIELDDFVGLKLITSRIVNYLLKICFYLDKKYIPYSKWFGTTLKTITFYDQIQNLATTVLTENESVMIEKKLCKMYEKILNLHNMVGALPTLHCEIRNYHDRPYKVIMSDQIVDILIADINDNGLKSLNLAKIALDIKLDSVDFTE